MSATTATALKAFIEGLGLGLSAYHDVAPQKAAKPYVVILTVLPIVPDPLEDGGAVLAAAQPGATRLTGSYQTVTEPLQLDLWQTWRDTTTNALIEDVTLADKLLAALQGARLPSAPKPVYGCLVRSVNRFLERDQYLVHHAITLDVKRQL